MFRSVFKEIICIPIMVVPKSNNLGVQKKDIVAFAFVCVCLLLLMLDV